MQHHLPETTQLPETVHIIPLGHEYDRAVRIFENSWVNRVYLLSLTQSEKHDQEMIRRQIWYTNRVMAKLKGKNIEVIPVNVNMFDIREVMKHVTGIILKETKPVKNIIYVNMSACGRLTSVGATLAAMVHNAIVYYVIAERYSESPEDIKEHGLSICERGETVQLQNFQLVLPEEQKEHEVLRILLRHRKTSPNEPVATTEEIEGAFMDAKMEGFEDYRPYEEEADRKLKQHAREDGFQLREKVRRTQIRNLMKLKVILDRLEKGHYITRKKGGRSRSTIVRLTDSGEYAAYILGLAEGM